MCDCVWLWLRDGLFSVCMVHKLDVQVVGTHLCEMTGVCGVCVCVCAVCVCMCVRVCVQIYNPIRSILKVKVYLVVGFKPGIKRSTDSDRDLVRPSNHHFSVDVKAGTEVGLVADGAPVGTEFQNQSLSMGGTRACVCRPVCLFGLGVFCIPKFLAYENFKNKNKCMIWFDCFYPFLLIYIYFSLALMNCTEWVMIPACPSG